MTATSSPPTSRPLAPTTATPSAASSNVGLDDALRVLVVSPSDRTPATWRAATRFAARVMLVRRLGLAEARYVLALAEALPRSPDAVGLLLRPYCR